MIAFLDRVHAYLPGWEIPKLGPESYSRDYGFITDYFCEIMHELRKLDPLSTLRARFELLDAAGTTNGMSGRDQRAIYKVTSGLLKLLYPHSKVTDAELEEVLIYACELRQRVRNQLHLMAPGEYDRVQLGVRVLPHGSIQVPDLPEAGRVQKVTLPTEPAIGEVIGLAVSGDHGVLLRFEMQATRGSGRIVPLGSIQRVMRESIEAAAQYIKANFTDLGISADWRENIDIAVLATYMGIPKEGPSAGVAIVSGIVSALKGIPVRNDLAMTGEITIMGKVLPVGGIPEKVRAAYDAGIKEVLLPVDNMRDAEMIPDYIKEAMKITLIESIEEVFQHVLIH